MWTFDIPVYNVSCRAKIEARGYYVRSTDRGYRWYIS